MPFSPLRPGPRTLGCSGVCLSLSEASGILAPVTTHDPALEEAGRAGLDAIRQELRRTLVLGDLAPAFPDGTVPAVRRWTKEFRRGRTVELLDRARRAAAARDPVTTAPETATALFAALSGPPGSAAPPAADEEEPLTAEQTHPDRIWAAWRYVREHGRLAGRLQPTDPLQPALLPAKTSRGETEDPWVTGYFGALGVVRDDGAEEEPLPIAPPPVPAEWLADRQAIEAYDPSDPEDDPELHRWARHFSEIARTLNIGEGSTDAPRMGQRGLRGLSDPQWCRLLFPTRTEILAFEEYLVNRTLEVLVEGEDPLGQGISSASGGSPIGTRGAMVFLTRKYGLLPREAQGIISMARDRGKERADGDLEQNRAMMVLRLESFIARIRQINFADTRSELMALKQLAIVQGLAKADVQDDLAEILRGFDNVATLPGDQPQGLPDPGDEGDDED